MTRGQIVWFTDAEFRDGKEVVYPEWGRYVKSTKKGFCLIDAFFGKVEFNKEFLFETKEECEKYIQEEIKNITIRRNHGI